MIDLGKGLMTDFFMSCRVQRKRVEHGFFALAAERLRARGHDRFRVAFRATDRNKAAVEMLTDLGFVAGLEVDGEAVWSRVLAQPFADADIVRRRKPETARAA